MTKKRHLLELQLNWLMAKLDEARRWEQYYKEKVKEHGDEVKWLSQKVMDFKKEFKEEMKDEDQNAED